MSHTIPETPLAAESFVVPSTSELTAPFLRTALPGPKAKSLIDADEQEADTKCSEPDGNPLRHPRPLVENDEAHRDVEQWHQEISEARLQHASVVHRPDKGQPVHQEQGSGDEVIS